MYFFPRAAMNFALACSMLRIWANFIIRQSELWVGMNCSPARYIPSSFSTWIQRMGWGPMFSAATMYRRFHRSCGSRWRASLRGSVKTFNPVANVACQHLVRFPGAPLVAVFSEVETRTTIPMVRINSTTPSNNSLRDSRILQEPSFSHQPSVSIRPRRRAMR